MKKADSKYIIYFGGLKEGVYDYDFIMEQDFFDEFEYLEAHGGKVQAHVTMNKYEKYITLNISMKGNLILQCDRCLEDYSQDIYFEDSLLIKYFDDSENELDEEKIIYIHPEDKEIDLKHYFFENIGLSIPYRRIHPDINGETTCNKEMLKYIINIDEKDDQIEDNIFSEN